MIFYLHYIFFFFFSQQRQEVAREQEALRQREAQLNEQQKNQIRLIDAKLAELRNERENLAHNQQQLSPGKQEQLEELQAKRRAILSPDNANVHSMQQNSSNPIQFPSGNPNIQSMERSPIQSTISTNSPYQVAQDQFAQQRNFPSGQTASFHNQNGGNNPQGPYGSQMGNSFPQPNEGGGSNGGGEYSMNPQQHQMGSYQQPNMQQHQQQMNRSGYPNSNNNSNFNQSSTSSSYSSQHHQQQSYNNNNNNNNNSVPQSYSNNGQAGSEVEAWKREQAALQNWDQESSNLQRDHQEKLAQQEREYMQSLKQREDALRSQWTQELTQQQADNERQRSEVHQRLSDDMLLRMSEVELRLWLDHEQKNQFIDEMLARRQRLLDEQAWLLQQDLENKSMALSFKEDDLRKREWEIEQQREAEKRALQRVFCIIVETTNPEGKRTGKTYQMQVRAGDSLFRICERIPHDKELFCIRMDYNGQILEDLDKNLLELRIPDNAFMISRLLPKADVDVLNLIPCEDCGKRYHAEVFAAHKCMKNFTQELPRDQRRSQQSRPQQSRTTQTRATTQSRPQSNTRVVHVQQPKRQEVIPCEYCEGLFPTAKYDSHVRTCSSRTTVPRVTRYRYY